MTLLTNFGVTETFYIFRLVVERKTGNEISKSLKAEFLEKLLTLKFLIEGDSKLKFNTHFNLLRLQICDFVLKFRIFVFIYSNK